MKDENMSRMMKEELKKIRGLPAYTLYAVATPEEIDVVREKLRRAKIYFRTEPVTENNVVVCYKVYVL